MDNDSIQKIIEEMRDAVWPDTPGGEELTAWADRLEVLEKHYDEYFASLLAQLRVAERRISDASWAADQASNHRMGL